MVTSAQPKVRHLMKSGETTASFNSAPHAHFERTDRHILPFTQSGDESSGRRLFWRVHQSNRGPRCHVPRVIEPGDSIDSLDERSKK